MELSEFSTGNKRQRHSARVILPLFCAMRYINDPRYPSGDERSKDRWTLSPRAANLAFKCPAPRPRAIHRKKEIMHVVNSRNI